MTLNQDKSPFHDRFVSSREIASKGVKAEPVGRHSIRLSKSGRMLGIWRKAVGCYQWFPAGQNVPKATVVTLDDAIKHTQKVAN